MLPLVMAIEYFHQYLYGRKFTVKTDHLPLTWLSSKKNVQARLEVENESSESDSNADVISKNPTSAITTEAKILSEEQLKDAIIQWIKNSIIKHGEKKPKISIFENYERRIFYKQYHNFILVEGILYRNSEDRNGYRITQFVLPKLISQKVIEQIHSSVYNGHIGRAKTSHKITERFY